MTSPADVRAAYRPATVSVRVPLRGDLLGELQDLEDQLELAKQRDLMSNGPKESPPIAERIGQLEQELLDSEIEFRFRGIGRGPRSRLLSEHPPTQAQQAEAKADGGRLLFNIETFPPALMAAACVLPEGWAAADFAALWEEWTDGQTAKLWQACLAANQGAAETPPKSVTASVIRLASKLS